MLEHRLGVLALAPPAPPALLALAAFRDIAGAERPALRHLRVHPRHPSAFLGSHVGARRLGMLEHAIADERIQIDRQQAGGVSPVLEQLALLVGERVEQIQAIRSEPCECGHIVRADEHVHRVDLEQVKPRRQGAQMCQPRFLGPRPKPLRGNRQPSRLGQGQGRRWRGCHG